MPNTTIQHAYEPTSERQLLHMTNIFLPTLLLHAALSVLVLLNIRKLFPVLIFRVLASQKWYFPEKQWIVLHIPLHMCSAFYALPFNTILIRVSTDLH